MRELIIAVNISNLWCECCEDMVGNVYDEICYYTLLHTLAPIPIDVALFLIQLLCLAAHVQTSHVIIILRRVECLKVSEIPFDHPKLLFAGVPFSLVNDFCFIDCLALLEVGFGFELFEHIEDGILAHPAHCLLGQF